ncbi:MAG: transketolase [Chloroflexi bacterium]|nr:transketolase [Chloroflexota bacterium]
MPESREALLDRLNSQALQLRREVWRTLHAGGSGHVGGSLSAAELLTALYFHTLRYRVDEPRWPDRDRFVLSKGHANAGLSAVLAMAGFFPEAWLDTYYHLGSPLGMHPDIKVPGVELSTGALGHGLAAGVGMALGARITSRDYKTIVLLGDGECEEGSVWEAALCAGRYQLDNMLAIVDFNKVQQSGHVSEIMTLDPLPAKWRDFGFEVREIDGHDMGQVVDALDAFPWSTSKPSALVAHTVKGKGVSFAENTYVWHSNTVSDDVLEKALAELGTR